MSGFKSRPHVLHEATYRQVLDAKPNVAVLPWGATEAHNYHLPHGTDTIVVGELAEAAVARANAAGARCLVLPAIPVGNDNLQLSQAATLTLRTSTQQAILHDLAESLVRQGMDRLVVLNGHGGNDFKQMIRDVMLDLPIFIVQASGWAMADCRDLLIDAEGDHANEFETSIMLHLRPDLVDLPSAGPGAATPYKLPALKSAGVWAPRDWKSLTSDTGVGDPRAATAENGRQIFDRLVAGIVPVLTQLSAARNGDFPFVIRKADAHDPSTTSR